ncbi:hypothetical protein Ciccas_009276 [Cichlidogyrus casuarinus]|uniref:Uncharacterized protein n=1 Tax=Cichlidogyrus casuarinus TaxID=1844966 RepID=A0ABD2PXI7_9PLAT
MLEHGRPDGTGMTLVLNRKRKASQAVPSLPSKLAKDYHPLKSLQKLCARICTDNCGFSRHVESGQWPSLKDATLADNHKIAYLFKKPLDRKTKCAEEHPLKCICKNCIQTRLLNPTIPFVCQSLDRFGLAKKPKLPSLKCLFCEFDGAHEMTQLMDHVRAKHNFAIPSVSDLLTHFGILSCLSRIIIKQQL